MRALRAPFKAGVRRQAPQCARTALYIARDSGFRRNDGKKAGMARRRCVLGYVLIRVSCKTKAVPFANSRMSPFAGCGGESDGGMANDFGIFSRASTRTSQYSPHVAANALLIQRKRVPGVARHVVLCTINRAHDNTQSAYALNKAAQEAVVSSEIAVYRRSGKSPARRASCRHSNLFRQKFSARQTTIRVGTKPRRHSAFLFLVHRSSLLTLRRRRKRRPFCRNACQTKVAMSYSGGAGQSLSLTIRHLHGLRARRTMTQAECKKDSPRLAGVLPR